MADLNFQKVDLSSKAIAHDGSCLQVLLETANGYSIESLSAPEQAFQGLQQLARFASLTQSTLNSAITLTALLDEIGMIPLTLAILLLLAGFTKTDTGGETLLNL